MPNNIKFIHMVYFWLANPGSEDDTSILLAGINQHLSGIPGVLYLGAGIPAGTDRDVVDNSYGVGLAVGFADAAAHDVYQDHPDHLAFIAACKHVWSRVQVYDTVLP